MATSRKVEKSKKRKLESDDESAETKTYKDLEQDAKDMIASVYNFLNDELRFTKTYNEGKTNLTHLMNVRRRTAEACGVSMRAVSAAVNQKDKSRKSSSKKSSKFHSTYLNIEDYFSYRRIVLQQLSLESVDNIQLPLKNILKRDCGYTGGVRKLELILKKLCFYQKNTKKLIENYDVKKARYIFLARMAQYRADNRPIVYIGEILTNCTWKIETMETVVMEQKLRKIMIHTMLAISRNGLLSNTMIHKHSEKFCDPDQNQYFIWLTESVVPNLPEKSVIVVDQKLYENFWIKNKPDISSSKPEIIEYLIANGILCHDDSTRAELLAIAKESDETIIDKKLARHIHSKGLDILTLPPSHKELNVVENVLELVKKPLETENISSFDEMTEIIDKLLKAEKITVWCDLIEVFENEYSNLFDCDRLFDADAVLTNTGVKEERNEAEGLFIGSSDDESSISNESDSDEYIILPK